MKYTATLADGSTVGLELDADYSQWGQPRWSSGEANRWLVDDSEPAVLVNLDHVMSIVPADRAQVASETYRDADGNEWTKRLDGRYETPTADGHTVIHALDEVKRIYGMGGQRAGVSYADHPWRA